MEQIFKKLQITKEVHKRLDVFRAEHECRTFSDAIEHSLNTHDKILCDKLMKENKKHEGKR